MSTEEIAAGIAALLVVVRAVVKFTKTDADDKVLKRATEAIKRTVG